MMEVLETQQSKHLSCSAATVVFMKAPSRAQKILHLIELNQNSFVMFGQFLYFTLG